MDKLWASVSILVGLVLIYGGWTGSYTSVRDVLLRQAGPATETATPVPGIRTGGPTS